MRSLAAKVLKRAYPAPAADPPPDAEAEARRRLKAALAHEREKVGKLKTRVATLEAAGKASSSEISKLYMALTMERHPPALTEPAAAARWADAAGRARLQVRRRGEAIRQTGLHAQADRQRTFPTPAALDPPAGAPWRPLRVAIVGSGRPALMDCPDPRVLAGFVGDPLVEEADVLVLTAAHSVAFIGAAQRAPEALWRRVREGSVRIVLDGAGEGFSHSDEVSRAHHAFLQERGVQPADAIYLTQDRLYRDEYEAWCRAESVRPMRVHVFDTYFGRVLNQFDLPGEQVFKHRLARYLERPPQRSRRFLSLNYTPRPTKALFLLRLLRDDLWEQGWISFGGFFSGKDHDGYSRSQVVKRIMGLQGFRDDATALLPLLDQLDAMGPVLFMRDKYRQHGKQRAHAVKAMDIEQYDDCWFTVVTETEMSSRLHRITEKPLKPLLSFHPFLVLGNPGSLQLLRGYGFETFGGVFDERYDEEPDPRRRFDMVYDEVRRLCALDEADMARASAELSEVVIFNACWGITELPRRFREQVVGELVDQLFPGAESPGSQLASSRTTA